MEEKVLMDVIKLVGYDMMDQFGVFCFVRECRQKVAICFELCISEIECHFSQTL